VYSSATPARVVELTFEAPRALTLQECKAVTDSEALAEWQSKHGIHIILQPRELYLAHRKPGLAVFDMDSTLIQQEVIDELARAVGFYDQVAAITERAMRGELDFEASLRERVALLKGVPTTIWADLKRERITFTPGAAELVRALRRLGWRTAVFSGGFVNLASWVQSTLGLDHAHANQLVAGPDDADPAKEVLTGKLLDGVPIIHAEKKRELLLQVAAEHDTPIERVIAVGDGSNDLLMMGAAGLGIAFNAKPKVQRAAPSKINTTTLLDVMYILGYSRAEIDELSATSMST